jgi:hypothetical protein
MDDHEVLVDDGFDGSGLDKTIEFMAPASPRGVKHGEDGLLAGCCLSLGGVQESGGSSGRLRRRESRANGRGDCEAERPASDHEAVPLRT